MPMKLISMKSMKRSKEGGGFTLVEVLVVMAIISVLAGIVLGSLTVARRYSDTKITQQEIQTLVQGINQYNIQYGDYPPSTFSLLKVKASNSTNEGNEVLILCLTGRKRGGPFHEDFKETRLENTDHDSLSKKEFQNLNSLLDLPQTSTQLFEYVDNWGNPFVYIHNRDYKSKGKIQYCDRDGRQISVQAARSKKLGMYQAPNSFQIWSFGPNRRNENGDGDDIASWK